jgi:hypothetical protein
VCPGVSISAGRSAVVRGESAAATASRRARSATWHLPAGPYARQGIRQESDTPVQDRPLGSSGHPAVDAGQRLSEFSGRVVELIAAPKSVFLALRRFLLVTSSNAIRTCVQGFTGLRDTGKPLTCDDVDSRVQESRSAAERGFEVGDPAAPPLISGTAHTRAPTQPRPTITRQELLGISPGSRVRWPRTRVVGEYPTRVLTLRRGR